MPTPLRPRNWRIAQDANLMADRFTNSLDDILKMLENFETQCQQGNWPEALVALQMTNKWILDTQRALLEFLGVEQDDMLSNSSNSHVNTRTARADSNSSLVLIHRAIESLWKAKDWILEDQFDMGVSFVNSAQQSLSQALNVLIPLREQMPPEDPSLDPNFRESAITMNLNPRFGDQIKKSATNPSKFSRMKDEPITTQCAWCNAVRHPESGEWIPFPEKIDDASHGICPTCMIPLQEQIEERRRAKFETDAASHSTWDSSPVEAGHMGDRLVHKLSSSIENDMLNGHVHMSGRARTESEKDDKFVAPPSTLSSFDDSNPSKSHGGTDDSSIPRLSIASSNPPMLVGGQSSSGESRGSQGSRRMRGVSNFTSRRESRLGSGSWEDVVGDGSTWAGMGRYSLHDDDHYPGDDVIEKVSKFSSGLREMTGDEAKSARQAESGGRPGHDEDSTMEAEGSMMKMESGMRLSEIWQDENGDDRWRAEEDPSSSMEDESFVPLTGKDYPWLCSVCRDQIDAISEMLPDMEDTDDPEAACNFCYDHGMFCGGHECVNEGGDAEDTKKTDEEADHRYDDDEPNLDFFTRGTGYDGRYGSSRHGSSRLASSKFRRMASVGFLSGDDYPDLCPECRSAVNQIFEMLPEMGDTDDPEAAMMIAGDRKLLCGEGGVSCGKSSSLAGSIPKLREWMEDGGEMSEWLRLYGQMPEAEEKDLGSDGPDDYLDDSWSGVFDPSFQNRESSSSMWRVLSSSLDMSSDMSSSDVGSLPGDLSGVGSGIDSSMNRFVDESIPRLIGRLQEFRSGLDSSSELNPLLTMATAEVLRRLESGDVDADFISDLDRFLEMNSVPSEDKWHSSDVGPVGGSFGRSSSSRVLCEACGGVRGECGCEVAEGPVGGMRREVRLRGRKNRG